MQQQTRKLLLQQLQRKFTTIPKAVRQRIETTASLEQLETWLTQVMMANSLADTELGKLPTPRHKLRNVGGRIVRKIG